MACNRWISAVCIFCLSSCTERVADVPSAEESQSDPQRTDTLLKIYRESAGVGNSLDETLEKSRRHGLVEEALREEAPLLLDLEKEREASAARQTKRRAIDEMLGNASAK